MRFACPALNACLRMGRVPRRWQWRELTQQVQTSPPLPSLSSESRHGWKHQQNISSTTWPLSPALDLEKLCRKEDSVSLTGCPRSVTSSCEIVYEHKVPVGLPKSCAYFWACVLQAAHWGGGDLTVCCPCGVPFTCTQAVLAASARADFGTWFNVAVGQLFNTVQTYFSFFQFLAFLLSGESKKTNQGDSSCEDDTRSPWSWVRQTIISQVRTFKWVAASA